MSLRDVIDAEMKHTGRSSLLSALETAGFASVDATLVNEALLHYAQSAPLAQADSLEQLVTTYHNQSVGISQVDETFTEDPFTLDAPLNQWLSEKVNDPAELDNLDDYDITELDLEVAAVTSNDLAISTENIEFGSGSAIDEDDMTDTFESASANSQFEVAPLWETTSIESDFAPQAIEDTTIAELDIDDEDASDLDDIDFD